MKILSSKVSFIFLVTLLAVLGACRKGQQTNWDTQVLVPIASTNLSLQNLIKDTSTIKTNKDSSLTLSYQSSLYQFNLADQIVKIPDTSIGQKFTLSSLVIPNQSIDYRVTLATLANNLVNSSNPTNQILGNAILAAAGDSAIVPAISNIPIGSQSFDASEFFDTATFLSGFLKIWAVNRLPIPITNIAVSVVDSITGIVLYNQTIAVIPSNDSVYLQVDLSGRTITSHLLFNVTSLSSPGSSGQKVLINLNDFFEIRLFATSLRVSDAYAKFPTQNVVDLTGDVTVQIADRKFTYIEARSGFLHIYITNSVPQPLYLQYTLVGAYDNRGNPLVEYTNVPPAPVGGVSEIDTLINIAGFSINLTGQNGSEFNTYTQNILARINYTGQTQHITLSDSLDVRYELKDIAPNYIKGYAGRDTIANSDSTAFSFLNIFKSGTIDLASVNMNFSVINGIGVDGQVVIDSLTAYNSNNQSVKFRSGIVGQPLTIKPATDFPLTPSVNNFSFNNSNSNIKDILNLLPNRLYYGVHLKTNVNGNNNQYREFAYLTSSLGINLNAEVPLSLIANNLVLQDTIAFNLSNTNTNLNGISDGVINVIAENKYPIVANLSIIIYDGNWKAVDTLVLNKQIAPGNLDSYCRVDEPTKSVIQVSVNQDAINRLKQGQNAVITSSFSTASSNPVCNGQHLKIYSDYTVGITLSAKFNYKANAGLN